MNSPSIRFQNPPVSEVIVSTYFNPPLTGLRSEHIGLFWGKIKKNFPKATPQVPVGIPPDFSPGELFPMPRYWFISANDTNVIQVQKNAFMFNWRLRNEEYPRFYREIKPAFDKYFGLFSEFVRTETNVENLSVDLCELAYINTLERSEYWTGPRDTTNVFPSFSMLTLGDNPSGSAEFNCNFAYRPSPEMQLNIAIRSGQGQNGPILIFEIRARGRLGKVEKSRADEWFGRSHAAITHCFLDITSQDIQNRYWKPIKERQ